MEVIDLIGQCKLYKDLIDIDLELYKLPLTGINENTNKKELKELFQKNYNSVIHVEIEKSSTEEIYFATVVFENKDEYFHAMSTMFFNLNGSLLMAISILDEFTQKEGIHRVLRIKSDLSQDSRY